MTRLMYRRSLFSALLFALMALAVSVSTACKGGVPSGSTSKAANNVQSGSSGGSSGGSVPTPGTQTGTLRLIAWDSGPVYVSTSATTAPIRAAGQVWCFITNNSNTSTGATFAQPTVTLNGTAVTVKNALPIHVAQAPSNAWLITFDAPGGTIPANGSLIASASVNGTPLTSNTVTTKNAPAFPAGNTFAGGFVINSPVDSFATGYQPQAAAATFNFSHSTPAGVSSYQFLTLYMQVDFTGGTLDITGFDIEHSIETAAIGTITAGDATGVTRDYANEVLLTPVSQGNDETYAFQIIALDSTGWGVGSTVESSGLSNWIWFETQ